MSHARSVADAVGPQVQPDLFPEVIATPTPWSPEDHVDLCGIRLTRTTLDDFLLLLQRRLLEPATAPLAVGSVNLDHIHHFAHRRGRSARPGPFDPQWLMLADGSPISRRATTVTGRPWPRLAGADLLPSALDVALETGASVGFLGGTPESVAALKDQLRARWSWLDLAGLWTPPRASLVDPHASSQIAADIDRAGVDLLVVGLGKPLQEQWIDHHGARTGARVLTAFGGAADFLGGTTRRAPRWMRERGCEWLFRLSSEPRRLSKRYLVQGPPALARLMAERHDEGVR